MEHENEGRRKAFVHAGALVLAIIAKFDPGRDSKLKRSIEQTIAILKSVQLAHSPRGAQALRMISIPPEEPECSGRNGDK